MKSEEMKTKLMALMAGQTTANLTAVGSTIENRVDTVITEIEKQKAEAKAKAEAEPLDINVLIEQSRQALANRRTAVIAREGGRVREQYGELLTDDEIIHVINFEDEMRWCKHCRGKFCNKTCNRGIYKVAVYDTNLKALQIKEMPCQRLEQEKYKLSKIPVNYIGKTFEDYEVDNDNSLAVKAAKKMLENGKGAYFYGGVGTGKTLLAAVIAQELIKRGRRVIFATVPIISMRLRSTFNKGESKGEARISDEDILEKLYTVPTLILDDIGMEKPTRFVCSTLCNIFNERYNANLQTIMTSNYPLKALESIFNNPTDSREQTLDGSRIYDRCKQMCVPIELKGKSRRG